MCVAICQQFEGNHSVQSEDEARCEVTLRSDVMYLSTV